VSTRAKPRPHGQRHSRAFHGRGRGGRNPGIRACHGAADVATVLYTKFLKFDPAHPAWPIATASHASRRATARWLLYSLLYLCGYAGDDDRGDQALPPARLQDPRTSRISSPRASNPPPAAAPGLANAVAWRSPSASSPRSSAGIVDHFTYALASRRADGDQPRRSRSGGCYTSGSPIRALGKVIDDALAELRGEDALGEPPCRRRYEALAERPVVVSTPS